MVVREMWLGAAPGRPSIAPPGVFRLLWGLQLARRVSDEISARAPYAEQVQHSPVLFATPPSETWRVSRGSKSSISFDRMLSITSTATGFWPTYNLPQTTGSGMFPNCSGVLRLTPTAGRHWAQTPPISSRRSRLPSMNSAVSAMLG